MKASVQDSLSPEVLFPLVEHGEINGVRVSFWNVNEKYDLDDPNTLCPWPFERAYVSSDLRVVPCCYVGNPDVFEIGKSLTEASLADLWRGDVYREFRRAHLEGRLPDICRGCYRNPGSRGRKSP
jgi:pyrroloquinoline quinone biosynthesis protein E